MAKPTRMPDAEELKSKHWSEIIAGRVVEEKAEPYIVTSGMTTSGPTHLGTVCEFLYPSAIVDELRLMGKEAEFYFIADIFDAFDSVPAALARYETALAPHLGKPLSEVPDPMGCCPSFGEHFLNESIGVMRRLGINPKIFKASDLYKKGEWDNYAHMYLKREDDARRAVAESSLKKVEEMGDWSPIMPICENCGRIATTRVTAHGEDWYDYLCDRDVKYTKGCGHKGRNRISDHRYKITWRLHWPTWQDYFKTSCEGAGMDHHTRGGSWDTVLAVFKEIFRKAPPIGYKFGFVLLKGRKYSKSKGIGMGVADLLELMPPELVKYALLKPDLQENKDIDPTGAKLMALYEEFQSIARIAEEKAEKRAEHKKQIAFRLATGGKISWRAPFADVLMYYQLYRDWKRVAEAAGDEGGVAYLRPFIEKWVERNFAPEEYSFSFQPAKNTENPAAVKAFAERLAKGMRAVEIHNLVFQVAKERALQPAEFFRLLYKALINKERGPKMGKLIEAIGAGVVKEALLAAAG